MGRVRRKTCTWLAIVALLSNVLAAFVPSKASSAVDDLLGPLVICTSHGAAPLQDEGGSDGHTPSDHCPACGLIVQFVLAVTTPSPRSITFPAVAARMPSASGPGLLAVQLSLGGIRSRAPPFSA